MRAVFGKRCAAGVHEADAVSHLVGFHVGVPRQENRVFGKFRRRGGCERVAVRAEQAGRAVDDERVVCQAGEIEHHLVDFGVAVSPHRHDAFRYRVQHLRDLLRVVSVGQGVAGPVVQQVAEQHDLVGLFALHHVHHTLAPGGRTVYIARNDDLHDVPPCSFRLHCTTGGNAGLTKACHIGRPGDNGDGA